MRTPIKARARADLLAIRAWGEDHWGAARTRDFLEGLVEAIERLSEFPLMDRPRSVFFDGLRSIRHRGCVVFHILEATDLSSSPSSTSGATSRRWISRNASKAHSGSA